MGYAPPLRNYFKLPNEIFSMNLDPYEFKVYTYLVSCVGARGAECWPSLETMHRKLGIAVSTLQKKLASLEKRKLIASHKSSRPWPYMNNVYTLLSTDNPDSYRDISAAMNEPDELPLFIGEDLPA